MSRDRAHMSAIGREGGHSRGRARQTESPSAGGNGASVAGSQNDTERSSFVGQASDRGTNGNNGSSGNNSRPERNSDNSARNESGSRNF